MAKFEELKKIEFSYLISKIGQAHEGEEKIIRGHPFLVGWRVDESGKIGDLLMTKRLLNHHLDL